MKSSYEIKYLVLHQKDAEKMCSLCDSGECPKEVVDVLRNYGLDLSRTGYIAIYMRADGSTEYLCHMRISRNGSVIKVTASKDGFIRPVDSVHKFWARKPWWVVSQYILNNSSKGHVVCDPMCGSGVIGYEALRLGRRAILADLNPFAVFLSRNTLKPMDRERISKAYNDVMNRPIDRDVKSSNKIFIQRGTSVKNAIERLYITRCRVCEKDAMALSYIWDTVYRVSDDAKLGVAERALLRAASEILKGDDLSQLGMLAKWREIAEKAREIWVEEANKTGIKESENPFNKPKLSTITSLIGRLVRSGALKRVERRPSLVLYKCLQDERHRGLAKVDEKDLELVKEIESTSIPFPHPETKLCYHDVKSGRCIEFDTARPESLFVPNERMATWSEEEFKERVMCVHHLFTKRNLLALSILFWSIEKIDDIDVREKLLLAFTETLHKASKLNSYEIRFVNGEPRIRRATMWRESRFSIPPDFVEENVYTRYEREVLSIIEASEEALREIGDYYKEASSADEFIRDPSKTVLILRMDAKKMHELFKNYRDVVDMVFTDPPYGDAIQYYELCTLWTSWLSMDSDWVKRYGDNSWWLDEIVVNKIQRKDIEHFKRSLEEAFKSIRSFAKDTAVWVITYHKRDPRYWNALTEALRSIDLALYDREHHELLIRGFNPSKDNLKFLGRDAYTVWRSWVTQRPAIRSLEEAAEVFFNYLKSYVERGVGLVPRVEVENAFVSMAISVDKNIYEQFFRNKLDVFLKEHTIMLSGDNDTYVIIRRDKNPPGIGPGSWQRLWDRCYSNVDRGAMLREALRLYIGSKNREHEEVTIDNIYEDIVSKIDGVINQKIIEEALRDVAEYDWEKATYRVREADKKGLDRWMMPRKKLDTPEEIVRRVAQEMISRGFEVYIAREYSPPGIIKSKDRKSVDEDLKGFPLVIIDKKVCIDINSISRASKTLIKRNDYRAVILFGSDKVEREAKELLKDHIDKGRVFLVDVRGKSTEEIVESLVRIVGDHA